jgi:formate hydrogenlyase subunit 3/multisubunit Na+/H+ antiporter MnhD subunit
MPQPAPVLDAVTAGGFLLVLSLVVPVAGVLLAFVAGGRHVERIALATMLLGLVIAGAIAFAMSRTGDGLVYLLGDWSPPLGVALRADWLSAVMMATTAVVICAVGVFAQGEFRIPEGSVEARAPFAFWILLLAVSGALNTVFLAGDLFTLYVALELLTFSAVPLVCLDGRPETLTAALRYLLFALLGSVLYLVGTALLYGEYGTLDIVLLSHRIRADPATLVAGSLMTVGLLAKTALFPLHLWLPPAHAGAPAPASAVLSALVVKGSFFIVVRLWFDVMPGVPGVAAAQLLGALGAAAIVFGGVVALRQARLKLLIAYSTLAQIGYLFLMFPLAFAAGSQQLQRGGALAGGILQTISHATAKAAMFMAAGLIYAALGHDRIAGLAGIARALPVTVITFVLGGVALMGVPPSGAYLAKKLLLEAAAGTGQWWWALVLQGGAFFTAGYVLLVLAHALCPAAEPLEFRAPVSRVREAAALALALCSLLLALAPFGPVPRYLLSAALSPGELWSVLVLVLGGGLLAIGIGDRLPRVAVGGVVIAVVDRLRRAAGAVAGTVELADGALREWPVAGLSLLVLALGFGVTMVLGR